MIGCKNTDTNLRTISIPLNKNNIKPEDMSETQVEPQLYQWLKTEKAGEYVYEEKIEEEDGITFIKFTDGSQVNAELLGEYVIKVDSEDDGFEIKEEIIEDLTKAKLQTGEEIEIPGVMHGQRKVTMIPKNGKSKPKPKAAVKPKVQKEAKQPEPKIGVDPVIILLEKAKKEKHTYGIDLNVDAISKDLFNVVKDTFDEGEEKALDYIVSLIDMEKLKSQLKEKLKEVYNG